MRNKLRAVIARSCEWVATCTGCSEYAPIWCESDTDRLCKDCGEAAYR